MSPNAVNAAQTVNIYRVGYVEGDSADVPFTTISTAAIPETNIDALITEANAHEAHVLDIEVCASDMSVAIDGTTLSMGIAEGWGGMSERTTMTLSQLGPGGN